MLCIYGWERVQRYPWQIDLHLPAGSPFLFAHVRIINLFPLPYEIDFRMSLEGDDKYVPPQVAGGS